MEIIVNHFTKKMDGHSVLKNINLEFESGKIYGLQGRNGSGKTMLLRGLSGLILPDEGGVKIDGSVLGEDRSFPKSVGILIESPGLVPELSAMENLKMIASIKNIVTEETLKELLLRFHLDPEDPRPVKKYSLGMRQKVGLCMAVMEDPDLLLLDEPFNALDDEARTGFIKYLKNKKDEDKIIIIASHDREELEGLADVLIKIKNGEVISVEEKK